MKDVLRVTDLYPDAKWDIMYLPPAPSTVDVPHFVVGEEQVLPMQQILPDSQAQPLDL